MPYLSVKGFAKAIGKDIQTVQHQINNGSPIGAAYNHRKHKTYEVYPERVRELYGEDILKRAIDFSKGDVNDA